MNADVNDGMNTRDKVKAHDPLLATLLMQTYGDGPWRYTHTMPRNWGGSARYSAVHANLYVTRQIPAILRGAHAASGPESCSVHVTTLACITLCKCK